MRGHKDSEHQRSSKLIKHMWGQTRCGNTGYMIMRVKSSLFGKLPRTLWLSPSAQETSGSEIFPSFSVWDRKKGQFLIRTGQSSAWSRRVLAKHTEAADRRHTTTHNMLNKVKPQTLREEPSGSSVTSEVSFKQWLFMLRFEISSELLQTASNL